MNIESKVNLLIDKHVEHVDDLNIEHISCALDIKIGFNAEVNCYIRACGEDIILLKEANAYEMWYSFCHELGHAVLHAGKQHMMHHMFNELQEYQADHFAMLFMMPKKFIQEHKLYDAKEVSEFFNVPFDFALKRLELYSNNLRTQWG